MHKFETSSSKDVGIRIAVIARTWRKALDTAFAHLGLTDATWAPILHLGYGDGISQKELAGRIGIEPPTLVRILDILHDRGLIERSADQSDRRSRLVFLSPSGRDALVQMETARAALDEKLLGDFDQAQIDTLGSMFERIERRLVTLCPAD